MAFATGGSSMGFAPRGRRDPLADARRRAGVPTRNERGETPEAARQRRMLSFEHETAVNPGAAPGGTGSTGLGSMDRRGWDELLGRQQQYSADLSGGAPVQKRMGPNDARFARSGDFMQPHGQQQGLGQLEQLISGGGRRGGGAESLLDLIPGAQKSHIGYELGQNLLGDLRAPGPRDDLRTPEQMRWDMSGRELPGVDPVEASEDVMQNLPQNREMQSALQALQAQLMQGQPEGPDPTKLAEIDAENARFAVEQEGQRGSGQINQALDMFELLPEGDPNKQRLLEYILSLMPMGGAGGGGVPGGASAGGGY